MTQAQAVKIYEQGESFYVPQFKLTIGGQNLSEQVIRDVLEIKYRDDVEKIDSFEIRLNNWDAAIRKPKYEPPSDPDEPPLFDLGGFDDPVKKVEVWMGYRGNLRRMIVGEITTIEPDFPASGGLTLSIRGLNVLHRFRTEQHTFAWEKKTDSQIAEDLGRRPVKKGKPGLGIEVRTQPSDSEPEESYVFMDNRYDIIFLMNRARRHGYEVVLRVDDEGDEYLYFGPSENRGEPPAPYHLEWGKSLISFRPTLTMTRQVSEVIVRGWDRRRNRKIEGKATWQDLVPAGSERQRMEALAQAFGDRREIVTDQPVHTKKQAEDRAKRILKDLLKEMVKGSGSTVGLPDLRAGRRVQITGLGPRFDGEYYVTKTTHALGDSGYRTEFEARRENAPQTGGASSGGGG